LCVATLGDGRITYSFVVVRRTRSSYSSYAIRKTSQKIQIKQIKRGGGGGFFFFRKKGRGGWEKKKKKKEEKKKKKKKHNNFLTNNILLITSSQTTSQEVMLKFLIMGPQDFFGPYT